MNVYPGDNSVIIMDNTRIHYDNEDFNPIETAFSIIKSWIRRNRDFMEACNDPIYALLVACSQITPQMAKSYFEESIYI